MPRPRARPHLDGEAPLAGLLIRIFQLVFLIKIIYFFYNKLVGTVFQLLFFQLCERGLKSITVWDRQFATGDFIFSFTSPADVAVL